MRTNKPNTHSLLYGKVPPQALYIEEAVLGAIMLERDALGAVLEIIPSSEIFYKEEHIKIYKAILTLNSRGTAVDLLTVTQQITRNGDLESIGGAYYLTQLTMAVTSAAHIETHAKLIYEKHVQRELIRVSSGLINEAFDDATDPFDLVNKAQNELQVVGEVPGAKSTIHISTSATNVMKSIVEARASQDYLTGIPTGFPTMNDKMYGWQDTDLTILAARPAVGKTAFALNLAFNAVRSPFKKVHVGVFSLEMGDTGITKRAMAFMAKVNLGAINVPKNLSELELTQLQAAARDMKQMPIYLDDTAILTTTTLRNRCRKLISTAPEDKWLFIIDYLQLMTSTDTKGNREQQVSQISRGLKLLAKELKVPVIALSQLNRIDEDDEPDLKNLRESGAIEQDADNVMFLFQPSAKLIKEKPYYANKIMLKGAKFRNGETFLLPLQFDKPFQLFSEPQFEFRNNKPSAPVIPGFQNPNIIPFEKEIQRQDEPVDDIPF